jgi:MFS family permease
LILELTNSPFWVGVAAGFRGLGAILFALPSGAALDRFDRRKLLMLAQGINVLLGVIVGVLIVTGHEQLWHLLTASMFTGITQAIQVPARHTITYDLVGPERLLNANATNFLAFSIMRAAGPALGGIMVVAVGIAGAYFLMAALSLAAVLVLLPIPKPTSQPRPTEPMLASIREGLEYAKRAGPVRSMLILSLLAEVLGYSHAYMMPVIARDVLGLEADGLGYLMAAYGVGGLISNIMIASRGGIKARGWLLLGSIGSYGVLLMVFAASPWFLLSLVLQCAVGAAGIGYDTTQSTLLQTNVPDAVRGRVMGLYTFTLGLTPIGGFQLGIAAGFIGAPLAVGIGGALLTLSVLRMLPLGKQLND